MLLFWILLGLLVGLFAWAAWRQKRYAGASSYDRQGFADPQAGLGLHDDPDRR
ncbi:hypothetical protein IEZ26_16885 [Nocardioides cavernae]|uniref:Uncharacterized protein n=1 Tax=Nocardioides cavernae TaxID=1921566 RepID=A0ABR8NDU3_9ACTN|nr:hypothetical protein [Nocardioides cavernae]MBD3926304.1 hypothetical protein [Nocardioides cavernae]MBM7513897.1 hypothetical protein [Nocardioides cavernae]